LSRLSPGARTGRDPPPSFARFAAITSISAAGGRARRYTRDMHRTWAFLALLLTLASTPLAGAATPLWSRETHG